MIDPPPPRILHAPADVGGNAHGLSRAERELGLHSDVAVVAAGRYGYPADIDLGAGSAHSMAVQLRRRAGFLRAALSRYDIFHFNFGQPIVPVRRPGLLIDELPLLRRAGKTVLVTFQGCDVRPRACCFCRDPACLANDRYRQPGAARFLRYADRVFFLNPDLRHWLPGAEFTPYASVDPRRVAPAPPPPARDVLRVAHAPTDRDVKGTAHLQVAIADLHAEGVHVDLDLVERVDHTEVLRRCARADVVVDQLLLGWYGALSVEAMALGRPVLCFIREDEAADNPFGAELPIVRAGPATLANELRALAGHPERRVELGRRGRRFVEEHHDPRAIARRVLDGLVAT